MLIECIVPYSAIPDQSFQSAIHVHTNVLIADIHTTLSTRGQYVSDRRTHITISNETCKYTRCALRRHCIGSTGSSEGGRG